MKRLIITCITVVSFNVAAVSAALCENLFAPLNKVYDVDSTSSDFAVQRQGSGQLNTNLLHRIFNPGAGDQGRENQVSLQMLDGSQATLHLRGTGTKNVGGIRVLSGSVDGDSSNMATLVNDNGNLSGRIWKNGTLFQIKGDESGKYQILEINIGHIPSGNDALDMKAGQDSQATNGDTSQQSQAPRVDEPVDLLITLGKRYVDKMKTPEAIAREFNMLIAETNNIYKQSGITDGIMFRIVGFYNLPYSGGDRLQDELPYYTSYKPLVKKRNEVGADLVAIITMPEKPAICGMGWIGPEIHDPVALPGHGFSITAAQCAFGGLTFAHELGHNLGARHDRFADSSKGDNHGYVNAAKKWRTVMAYNTDCKKNHQTDCPRIPLFSNPQLKYGGDSAGVPNGNDKAANNAFAVQDIRKIIAAYRPRADSASSTSSAPKAATRTTGNVVRQKQRTSNVGGIVLEPSVNRSSAKKAGKERKIKW